MSDENKLQGCAITGVGSYVPERILANPELESMVDTTDDWITSRTGIKPVSYTHLTLPTIYSV